MRNILPRAIAVALVFVTMSTGARGQTYREVMATRTVAILTDGINEPNGQASLAINELAGVVGHNAKLRVLPIAGLGAVANVRELLYLPGIDLAVLNSDIFAYLDQTRQHPEARRRIRQVTQLFDQQVYLLARKHFTSISELRGRKLAVLTAGGGGHITATTLFGLTANPVTIEALGAGRALDDKALEAFDGALLLSGEFARARLGERVRDNFHLIPIAMTPALGKAYRASSIERRDFAGLSEAEKIDTLSVATVLASFDWNTGHYRYANVSAFIQAMFVALPALRKQYPASSWRQVDIDAQLPGWTRYSAARPRDVLSPAELKELAKLERPPLMAPPPSQVPKRPDQQKATIKLLAAAKPPLADERLADGGLITDLLRQSLTGIGQGTGPAAALDVQWTRSSAPPVQAILNDPSVDFSFPFENPNCERPNDLTQTSAVLCDNALFSEPLIQVVIGLFRLSSGSFTFAADGEIHGKTICLADDRDASVLNDHGRNWLAEKRVTLLRQTSLLGCLGAVQKLEADAFVANDLEGRYLLHQLGLTSLFTMTERPLGMHSIHAVVSKNHPRASELMSSLNSGLKRLKQSEGYAAAVRQHLSRLWSAQTGNP